MHGSHTGHSRGRHPEQLLRGRPEAQEVISFFIERKTHKARHPDLSNEWSLSMDTLSDLHQSIISSPAVGEMAPGFASYGHVGIVAALRHLIILRKQIIVVAQLWHY